MGTTVDTKSLSPLGMTNELQSRLEKWFGPKTGARVVVSKVDEYTIQFDVYRQYGRFYEPPEIFSGHKDSVFALDQNIILGTDYEDKGENIDLSDFSGRYAIYFYQDDFFWEYKNAAKERHLSRIKRLAFEHHADRFTFIVQCCAKF